MSSNMYLSGKFGLMLLCSSYNGVSFWVGCLALEDRSHELNSPTKIIPTPVESGSCDCVAL